MPVRVLLLALLAWLPAPAQSLADVLCSIQERHQALEQRKQVEWYIQKNFTSESHPDNTAPAQNLIEWEGLTQDFPTDANTASLTIDQRIAVLNQAVDEMRFIQRQYINVRKDDIAADEKIGAMRPYLLEDFPGLGRVDASNYHAILRGLSASVRRLTVLEWPFAGFKKMAYEEPAFNPQNPNPSTIGPAPVVGASGTWEARTAGIMLEECQLNDIVQFSATFSQTLFFYEKVALYAGVPNGPDQLDGNVGVIIRNQWSPVDFSLATVVAPNSWDPNDGSCQVALVQNSASGDNYGMGDTPQITLPVAWTGDTIVPGGFAYPAGYTLDDVWGEWGDIEENSWESKYNMWGTVAEGGGEYHVLGRRLHTLFIPTFTKGLDATGKAANLSLAERASAGPSGDAKPLIHPSPGILAAIPLGPGLDGGVGGMIGITSGDEIDQLSLDRGSLISYSFDPLHNLTQAPGQVTAEDEPDYWELANRFDAAGSLRFIGPAQDFHVVYKTSRETTERGVALPALPPTSTDETNIGCRFFFRNWDLPRINQVVSRDFIVNIRPQGHYKNLVEIYRLPFGHVVDRTPGAFIDVGPAGLNLTAIRTLTFDNPDAGANDYPNAREKVHITEGSTTYKVWRTGDTNGDGVDDGYPFKVVATGGVIPADLHFEVHDGSNNPRYKKQINFSGEGNAAITNHADGTLLSTQSINDTSWFWYLDKEPNVRTIVSGNRTITVTNTFDGAEPVGSQSGWYPASVQITDTTEPTTNLTWNSSGRMTSQSKDKWSVAYSLDAGALKAESKFNGTTYATNWTEWTDNDTKIKTYSAPDGSVGSKASTKVAWSELELGNTTGTGLPGLPHELNHTDGTKSTWAWNVAAGGSGTLIEESGLFTDGNLTTGQRTISSWNERGYPTGSQSQFVHSGTVITSDSEVPAGEFTAWGAPKEFKNLLTGLSSVIAYEGSLNRLDSVTSPLGLVTDFNNYDVFDRAKQVVSNGVTANHTFTGLNITSNYSGGGTGAGASSSYTPSVDGTSVTNNLTWGGVTQNSTITRGASNVTIDATHGLYGDSGTVLRKDDGSLTSTDDETLAFGGLTGDPLIITNGLFVRKSKIAGQTSTYAETHTDAWGRTHKVVTPSADGSGSTDTILSYTEPADTLKRIIVTAPTGRVSITESETQGTITCSGIDIDKDGKLSGNQDRYAESTITIDSGKIVTILKITEDTGLREVLRTELTPSTGVTVTKINGNEETITATPNYLAKMITTSSTKGWSRVTALNAQGLAASNALSGNGVPTTNLTPTWRDDGSLASVSLTIGGDTHTASFNLDGTLHSLTVPGRGNILGNHSIRNGIEILTIDGETCAMALDGTSESISGGDSIARSTTLAVSGNGLKMTVDPAIGEDTETTFNAALAPTGKTYADASGYSIGYTNELPSSMTLARGGALTFGYSNDGAKDLVSAVWPQVASGPFTIPAVSHGYGYNRSGQVNATTDPSGTRAIDYTNGRVTSSTYTAGLLKGYAVTSARDGFGRHIGTTINRDNNIIQTTAKALNGASDQITNLATDGITATPQRDAQNNITGYIWSDGTGTVTQSWVRGPGGRIESASSDVTGAPSFTYLIDPQNPAESFDARNRRLTAQTEGGTWDYVYGAGGQLSSATHPTLGTFTYGFDGLGRRTDQGDANTTNILNQTTDWTHVQNKRVTIKAHPNARLWYNGVEVPNFTGTHQVAIAPPGPNGGWVQWEAYAILEDAGDGFGSPAPNPLANPDAEATLRGAVWVPPTAETLAYDAAGNRQSSSQWDYGWDAKNQLVHARSKDYDTAAQGYDLTFTYDAEGRRVSKHCITYQNGVQVAEKTVTFVWDGWDLLYERHQLPSGLTTLERKYLWGPDLADGAAGGAGGLLLIGETKGNTTTNYIPIYDGTGHVVALTDINKNLHATYAYGPFGEKIYATGDKANSNPWRWATKYLDEETGLYYFGHRFYDPITGQWLSREPLGESESVNLYAYCGNDPVNKVT